MARSPRYHGAIVCISDRNAQVNELREQINEAFENYGQGPDRSGTDSQVVGRAFTARIEINNAPRPRDIERRIAQLDRAANLNQSQRDQAASAAFRVQITLFAHTPVASDVNTRAMTLLADILLRAMGLYQADFVEWMQREVVLSAAELRDSPTALPPKRVAPRHEMDPHGLRFPPVDEAYVEMAYRTGQQHEGHELVAPLAAALTSYNPEERLALVFRTEVTKQDIENLDDRPSDILRLGIWAMTGVMAFTCAPVALTLALINLFKGEDFRLNTQALSVVGLFLVLNSNGSLAQAAELLPLIN